MRRPEGDGRRALPDIADRIKRNYETMEATLAAIARECEEA